MVAQNVLLSDGGVSKSWNLGSAAQQLRLSSPGISHASTPRFPVLPVRFALRCVKCQVAVGYQSSHCPFKSGFACMAFTESESGAEAVYEHWGLNRTFQLWC